MQDVAVYKATRPTIFLTPPVCDVTVLVVATLGKIALMNKLDGPANSETILSAIVVASIMVLTSGAGWAQTSSLDDNSYKITLPGAQPAFSWQSREYDDENVTGLAPEPRSEMLFRLSPQSFGASDESDTETADGKANWSSEITRERIDFLRPDEIKMQSINQGLSYSAAVEIESSSDFSSQSQFISSRQLGLHYGRLGPVNYSGVDLSFRQFNDQVIDDIEQDDKDLWSLGMTTGRRFALTGLDSSDPLWTVSLRGQFSLTEKPDDNVSVDSQLWFISPGFHWERDSFRLSADLLMPFLYTGENEEDTDYRVRAKIQKRF